MRWPVLSALATFAAYIGVVSIPSVAQQSSSIRVTVLNSHGTAVPAAEVHVVSLPDLIGLPSPKGTFLFKSVAPGTYQISATYPGFKDETISDVTVVEGKTTDVNITLEEGPPRASDYRIHQTLQNAQLYSKALSDIGQSPLCSQPRGTYKEWYRIHVGANVWATGFPSSRYRARRRGDSAYPRLERCRRIRVGKIG